MTTDEREHASGFSADRPIAERSADKLGRAAFAEALATQLIAAASGDGSVVALMGPWGSGKTSILNMVREFLGARGDVVVLHFNPWLFSGTEELVSRLLGELAAQCLERGRDAKLQALGKQLEGYADLLAPLGSIPGIGTVSKAGTGLARVAGRYLRRGEPKSLGAQRAMIDDALRALNKRVVILLDDLDRLRAEEIRDVVRLVRLTADFPNTAYLLAFDRFRVEQALSHDGEGGRHYLEKIVQAGHDVPELRVPDLAQYLVAELNMVLEGVPKGPVSQQDFENVFVLGILRLFSTVREVRRYLNALPVTLQVIGDEVALVDVLALEAVRTLLPDVFAKIPTSIDALTGPCRDARDPDQKQSMAAALRELIGAAGARREEAVRQLVRRLFPYSRTYLENYSYGPEAFQLWRRGRRVAHPDVLRFYLEKSLPPGVLAASVIQQLFDILGDEPSLTAALGAMDASTLEHAFGRLEIFEDAFPPESVDVAVRVFMNQLSRLREGTHAGVFFDFGADMALRRLVLRLLRRAPDQERAAIIEHTLPALTSLSGRWLLLRLVGHEEGDGHRLIGENDSHRLEAALCTDIRSAPPEVLAGERELNGLLWWALTAGGKEEERQWLSRLIEDQKLFLAVLRAAVSETRTLPMGDVAVTTIVELSWGPLVKLIGEELLKERIEKVAGELERAKLDERTLKALELAQQYAAGERTPSLSGRE